MPKLARILSLGIVAVLYATLAAAGPGLHLVLGCLHGEVSDCHEKEHGPDASRIRSASPDHTYCPICDHFDKSQGPLPSPLVQVRPELRPAGRPVDFPLPRLRSSCPTRPRSPPVLPLA